MRDTAFAGAGGLSGAAPLALLGAAAFVNATASVIAFPLAPFLTAELAVPAARAALVSLAFAAASGVGGLAAALLLGRCERRMVIVWALGGLAASSALAGLAPDFRLLLAARVAGGLCAGPLLAAVFALIPEMVAPARRNQALSLVVAAYGLALVLGLPAALALLGLPGGWRAAFLALAGVCAAVMAGLALLAPTRATSRAGGVGAGGVGAGGVGGESAGAPGPILSGAALAAGLCRPGRLVGLGLIASASFGTLLISPHLGTYALRNLGVPPAHLWLIYLLGGGLALVATQATGWAMDRVGTLAAALGVAAGLTGLLLLAFLGAPGPEAALPLLGLVLAGQLARSTVAQASAAQLGPPEERLSYQCLAAAVTSLAQAAGAGLSAALLTEDAQGRLLGMGGLALLSIATAWAAPVLVWRLGRAKNLSIW